MAAAVIADTASGLSRSPSMTKTSDLRMRLNFRIVRSEWFAASRGNPTSVRPPIDATVSASGFTDRRLTFIAGIPM